MSPTCLDEAGFRWRARGSKVNYWGAHEDLQATMSTNTLLVNMDLQNPILLLIRRAYKEALETGPVILPFTSRYNPDHSHALPYEFTLETDLAYDSQTVTKLRQARNRDCSVVGASVNSSSGPFRTRLTKNLRPTSSTRIERP